MHARIDQLAKEGQSLWIDSIRRKTLRDGGLAGMIEQGVVGLTSNPTIFHKAIAQSDDYDDALDALVAQGKDELETYEALVVEDLQGAADLLQGVYDRTCGVDGYVSLEVSPRLADDTEATIAEAKHLWSRVDRPNLMIKVPATEAGLPAIRALIAAGINVNVTLIFSCDVYNRVIEAYIAGLESRHAAGGSLGHVGSVASFFVSRIDTAVDKLLDQRIEAGQGKASKLLGKAAVANAKQAYVMFQRCFAEPRFQKLADAGARVQRPLWASTSTKNPAYSDTLYVDELIGPDTVNTMPPDTIDAFLDHGTVGRTIDTHIAEADNVLGGLKDLDIDLDLVTHTLREEGVAAFAKSFDALIEALRSRLAVA